MAGHKHHIEKQGNRNQNKRYKYPEQRIPQDPDDFVPYQMPIRFMQKMYM